MATITYHLSLTDDGHIRVKVTARRPDYVYIAGKTRARLTADILFFLRVSDVPINKDRLQNELDEMIWQHVPKRDWY